MADSAYPDFVATYWLHAGKVVPLGLPEEEASPHDFRARAEAAAAAGFRGIGMMHSDLMRVRSNYSFADMKAILADCGLIHLEFEFLVGWLEDGANGTQAERVFTELLSAADALGARHIKVGPDMDARDWPLEHMLERFTSLCARAAEVGTGIVLEPMPWSNVATVSQAVELVGGANCDNGGLLIDIWHMARGGNAYTDVASIPSGLIHHLEINDAASELVGSMFEDTVNQRLHCGRGAFDVPAFLHAVQAQGYRGPVGIEILSAVERERPYPDVLQDAMACARAQYDAITT